MKFNESLLKNKITENLKKVKNPLDRDGKTNAIVEALNFFDSKRDWVTKINREEITSLITNSEDQQALCESILGKVNNTPFTKALKESKKKKETKQKLNESLIESKPLNEGPGAGYNVKGTLVGLYDIEILDEKSEENEYGNNTITLSAKAKGYIKNVDASSYYYGRNIVDGAKIPVSVELRFNYWEDEFTVKGKEMVEVYDDDFIFDCVIGGGWSHITFNGVIEGDYHDVEAEPYGCDTEYFKIVIENENVIRDIDLAVTGDDWFDEYVVEFEDGTEEYFETEDEAIEYAKKNKGISVEHRQLQGALMSDFESEDIVDDYSEGVIWEREYSKSYKYDDDDQEVSERLFSEAFDKRDLYVNDEYVCSSKNYKSNKEFVNKVLQDRKVKYAGQKANQTAGVELDELEIKPEDKVKVKKVKDESLNEDVETSLLDMFKDSYTTEYKVDDEHILFLEGLTENNEGCDAVYDKFDKTNIKEVLVEVVDSNGEAIKSLGSFPVDTKLDEVIVKAKESLKEDISAKDYFKLIKQAETTEDKNELIELSKNDESDVRLKVVFNKNTPLDVLKKLANDKSLTVKNSARNKLKKLGYKLKDLNLKENKLQEKNEYFAYMDKKYAELLDSNVDVYDINQFILSESNNELKAHYTDKRAIIICANGKGCVVDYEAVGQDFDNIDSEISFGAVENKNNEYTDEQGVKHKTISIIATHEVTTTPKEVMEKAPKETIKYRDFFTKYDYNDRCASNFESLAGYIEENNGLQEGCHSKKKNKKLKEGYLGQTLEDFFDDCVDPDTIGQVTLWGDGDEPVYDGGYDGAINEFGNNEFIEFDCGGGKVTINVDTLLDVQVTNYFVDVQDFIECFNGDEIEVYDVETDKILFSGDRYDLPDDVAEKIFLSFDAPKFISINIEEDGDDYDDFDDEEDNGDFDENLKEDWVKRYRNFSYYPHEDKADTFIVVNEKDKTRKEICATSYDDAKKYIKDVLIKKPIKEADDIQTRVTKMMSVKKYYIDMAWKNGKTWKTEPMTLKEIGDSVDAKVTEQQFVDMMSENIKNRKDAKNLTKAEIVKVYDYINGQWQGKDVLWSIDGKTNESLKEDKSNDWENYGDVNFLTYGGELIRKLDNGSYQVISLRTPWWGLNEGEYIIGELTIDPNYTFDNDLEDERSKMKKYAGLDANDDYSDENFICDLISYYGIYELGGQTATVGKDDVIQTLKDYDVNIDTLGEFDENLKENVQKVNAKIYYEDDGEPLLVFKSISNRNGGFDAYSHNGQHTSATKDYVKTLKKANLNDQKVKDLIAEYESNYPVKLNLKEDTVKQNGKWVNKGDTGKTHGEFKTKKEADKQRKAMFVGRKPNAKWGK